MAHVGELREDAQDVAGARIGATSAMSSVAVGFAAAEEQSSVGRQSIVVEHEFGVGDRGARRDQRLRALLAERFGGDDVVRDRHDRARELWLERAEIAVAGDDGEVRRDVAARWCRPLMLPPRSMRDNARVFEDRDACVVGGAREAERIVQRMKVESVDVSYKPPL